MQIWPNRDDGLDLLSGIDIKPCNDRERNFVSNSIKRIRQVTQGAFGISGNQQNYTDDIDKPTGLNGGSSPLANPMLADYDYWNILVC